MLSFFAALALAADGQVPSPDAGTADAGVPAQTLYRQPLGRKVDEARVQRVFTALSLRERAAQLVMAYPQLKQGPVEVGGILFVGNSLRSVTKAKERLDGSRARARVLPFVAVDMEGGPSNRMKAVASLRALPSARELAELDDKEVKSWGRRVGEVMRQVGLNMNLAPVLDVAPTGHMARNSRSFSGDADVAARKAMAYSRGLLEAGIVPIGKHFPGYGDIDGDSDHALVTSDWPKERVFAEADTFVRVKDVLGGVMLANVIYAAVDEKPAILSPALVARVHEHDWLAITDDLSIALLAEAIGGTSEDVFLKAFMAGNDQLLTTAPPDWAKALDYVGLLTDLAQKDERARARVDESCLRVLRLKDRMGLLDGW